MGRCLLSVSKMKQLLIIDDRTDDRRVCAGAGAARAHMPSIMASILYYCRFIIQFSCALRADRFADARAHTRTVSNKSK